MTVESGHEPTEWGSAPRPNSQPTPAAQSIHYNSARHGSHVEESPELLRWRADLLMDEMMMGGVDVSAADSNRTFTGVDAPGVQRSQPAPNFGANGASNGGAQGSPYKSDYGRSPRDGYERNPYEASSRQNGGNGTSANAYPTTPYPNGGANGGYANGSQSSGNQANGNAYDAPPNGVVGNGSYPNGGPSNGAPRPTESGRPAEFGGDGVAPRAFDVRPSESRPSDVRPDTGNLRAYDEPTRQSPTPPTEPTNISYNKSTYDTYEPNRAASQNSGAVSFDFDDDVVSRDVSRDVSNGRMAQREEDARPSRQLVDEPRTQPARSPQPTQPPRSDRYDNSQSDPFRRDARANTPPAEVTPQVTPTRPPLTPLSPVEPPKPTTPPRVTPQPVDEHTQWATVPDKWEYQDYGTNPDAEAEEEPLISAYSAPERKPESAVRNDSSTYVGAMSMMGSGKKRSTLLPRSSTLDVDTLHREISDLHGEIAALLPVGNETGERARHLLDKAYSILQSDPMRSAEVEYYMQQVRTIVQRLYQARQWSDLYRQRLHVYLLGWLGLSAVMIIARFVFQADLERGMMWLAGVYEDHFLVTHWATFVGTAFAGALGGAIGALYTMQNHARGEHSFFDRKYGLRGLILPFMGLIVGAVGYLIFGLIFALVGINPSQSLTAAIVPTMAAFAFGFSQESIYGTRS